MSQTDPIGVGVMGMGFMGATHARCYHAAAVAGMKCELRAVCDPDPARLAGLEAAVEGNLQTGSDGANVPDFSKVRRFASPDELLKDSAIHLVSICTPTDTHVDLAIAALKAGKHVVVEKPVAVTSAEVERLLAAQQASGRLCIPAMCMRFWPGWDWLAAKVRDGSLGAMKSLTLQRMGSGPAWSHDFYRDEARSGGPMFDLHVHDTDFVYWLFGTPASVRTTGSREHFTTAYTFASAPLAAAPAPPAHVSAEGAWDLSPGTGFRMRYLATFEQATAEFDLGRTPTVMLFRNGAAEEVPLPTLSAYEREIRQFISALTEPGADPGTSLDDALAVTRLLEAEKRSLETGRDVPLT